MTYIYSKDIYQCTFFLFRFNNTHFLHFFVLLAQAVAENKLDADLDNITLKTPVQTRYHQYKYLDILNPDIDET